MSKKVRVHKEIMDEIHQLYINKNADYGDAIPQVIEKCGEMSYFSRIYEKALRLVQLGQPGYDAACVDEGILDTLSDIANYAVILMMERRLNSESGIIPEDEAINFNVPINVGTEVDWVRKQLLNDKYGIDAIGKPSLGGWHNIVSDEDIRTGRLDFDGASLKTLAKTIQREDPDTSGKITRSILIRTLSKAKNEGFKGIRFKGDRPILSDKEGVDDVYLAVYLHKHFSEFVVKSDEKE